MKKWTASLWKLFGKLYIYIFDNVQLFEDSKRRDRAFSIRSEISRLRKNLINISNAMKRSWRSHRSQSGLRTENEKKITVLFIFHFISFFYFSSPLPYTKKDCGYAHAYNIPKFYPELRERRSLERKRAV